MQDFLARNPNHPKEERIVDDRTFLLGLDELYRTGIKPHERTELRVSARAGSARWGRGPWPLPARRGSVASYAAAARMGVATLPVYTWRASDEMAKRAAKFVATVSGLFAGEVPAPTAENADYFGGAAI